MKLMVTVSACCAAISKYIDFKNTEKIFLQIFLTSIYYLAFIFNFIKLIHHVCLFIKKKVIYFIYSYDPHYDPFLVLFKKKKLNKLETTSN